MVQKFPGFATEVDLGLDIEEDVEHGDDSWSSPTAELSTILCDPDEVSVSNSDKSILNRKSARYTGMDSCKLANDGRVKRSRSPTLCLL